MSKKNWKKAQKMLKKCLKMQTKTTKGGMHLVLCVLFFPNVALSQLPRVVYDTVSDSDMEIILSNSTWYRIRWYEWHDAVYDLYIWFVNTNCVTALRLLFECFVSVVYMFYECSGNVLRMLCEWCLNVLNALQMVKECLGI